MSFVLFSFRSTIFFFVRSFHSVRLFCLCSLYVHFNCNFVRSALSPLHSTSMEERKRRASNTILLCPPWDTYNWLIWKNGPGAQHSSCEWAHAPLSQNKMENPSKVSSRFVCLAHFVPFMVFIIIIGNEWAGCSVAHALFEKCFRNENKSQIEFSRKTKKQIELREVREREATQP